MLVADSDRPQQKSSARTCVGCGAAAPATRVRRASSRVRQAEADGAPALVRLVIGPDRSLGVDTGAGTFGRGAYVHATAPCLRAAVSRGLPRAARGAVMLGAEPLTAASLAREVATAYDRRLVALIASARRARRLEVGSEAVSAAERAGRAALVLVAVDAAQAADLSEVRRAVKDNRALPWGTKASLADASVGAGSGREIGVVAITDSRIALAIKESWLISNALVTGVLE